MDVWCPPPYFIDKSEVIEAFLKCGHKITMISAPQGFLKTTNMRMIAAFVDGFYQQKTTMAMATATRRKLLWEESGLKIMRNSSLVSEYFGQWPYIYVTFSRTSGDSSCAFYAIVEIIRQQYERHKEIVYGPALSAAQKVIFNIYRYYRPEQISVGERKVSDALAVLCDMLYTYYGKQVFVFIDDYDVPLLEALDKEKPLINVQPFLAKMIASLHRCKSVKKVLLNAITSFTVASSSSSSSRSSWSSSNGGHRRRHLYHYHGGRGDPTVRVYRFLDDHKFAKFYAFTEQDVVRLVNKNRCSLEIMEQILSRHYTTATRNVRLYSPEWLLDFLKCSVIENPVWFEGILRKPIMTSVSMRHRLTPLEQGKCVKAKIMKRRRGGAAAADTHSDLLQLNRLLNGSSSTVDPEDDEVELLTRFLFEFGVFTYLIDRSAHPFSWSCLAGDLSTSRVKIKMNDTSRMASSLKSLSEATEMANAATNRDWRI